MDRIDFANSIDNLCDDSIMEIFNSVMALYNIVGNSYSNIKISKVPAKIASFDVTFESGTNVDEVTALCNDMNITVYEEKFYIQSAPINDTAIHVILKRRAN